MSAFRVFALIAAFSFSMSPAIAAAEMGALPSGGTFIVGQTSGAPVAVVELWYRAPAVGFGATPIPSLAHLAAQTVIASKPIKGDALGLMVADLGGRISINAYADSIDVSAVVPATAASDVVRAMTTAFFAPIITESGYREAQRETAQEALLESFNTDGIMRDAVFSGLFSAGPAHYPTLGDMRQVQTITQETVRSFAARAFRSQNAVLVVNGAVDAASAKAAVAGRAPEKNMEKPEPSIASTPELAPRLVTKRSDDKGGAYGWIGPSITQEREATAMDFIADYLFRPDLGVVSAALAESHPEASVTGQFITLHDPGVFLVSFTGKKPSEVKNAVDAGLEMMREPLNHDVFAAALKAFEYHLLSDVQTPLSVADNEGWYMVEGNATYAPGMNGENGAYFHAVHSLTPAFVAQVARRYLGKPGVTVVLAPKSTAPKKES